MKKMATKSKLTKEQKLALLEELLTELVSNIQMKETFKQIILQIIGEISQEDFNVPTTPTTPKPKSGARKVLDVILKGLGAVLPFLASIIFKRK